MRAAEKGRFQRQPTGQQPIPMSMRPRQAKENQQDKRVETKVDRFFKNSSHRYRGTNGGTIHSPTPGGSSMNSSVSHENI